MQGAWVQLVYGPQHGPGLKLEGTRRAPSRPSTRAVLWVFAEKSVLEAPVLTSRVSTGLSPGHSAADLAPTNASWKSVEG